MLDILGRGCATTCNGTTRRDFLKVGALGAIGFSLADFFAAKAAGRVIGRDERSAIMIFNLGAPSQLDTFDMKPDAPAEIRGPFKPISTKSPEIQISEIFPLHAKIADKFSLVRSCHHGGAAVHDAGWQVMQTGRVFTGGVNTPHAGSVVSYLRGAKDRLAGVRRVAANDGARRRQFAQRSGGRVLGQGARSVFADGRSVAAEFQGARFAAAGGDRCGAAGAAAEAAPDRRFDRQGFRSQRKRQADGRKFPGRVSADDEPARRARRSICRKSRRRCASVTA